MSVLYHDSAPQLVVVEGERAVKKWLPFPPPTQSGSSSQTSGIAQPSASAVLGMNMMDAHIRLKFASCRSDKALVSCHDDTNKAGMRCAALPCLVRCCVGVDVRM